MRSLTRIVVSGALIAAAGLAQSACSSHAGIASLPNVPPAATTSREVGTLSLEAFPISIDAYPISLGAYPVSLNAYPACRPSNGPKTAQCHGQYRNDIAANPNPLLSASQIPGYQPSDLQSAYGLTSAASNNGSEQTVAVIAAYSAPSLEKDLAVYRAAFGLSPCSRSNGCLTILNANGQTPSYDSGWATEATLDVEMVSATCPNCSIMLVRAADANFDNLVQAVDMSVDNGANVVSNSYSVPETSDVLQYASHYKVRGTPMTAGAGDQGYGVGFPASVPTVTAVGGTSLVYKTSAGLVGWLTSSGGGTWYSAVWPGTGSGCSAFFAKPSWQTDSGCSKRTVNDIAVVADPATGVAAYVTPVGGWAVFGGTSVGAPIVASMYALAGSNASNPSALYSNSWNFAPVIARSNGSCSPSYLCNGGPGYDGPSGLGTPQNLQPFKSGSGWGGYGE